MLRFGLAGWRRTREHLRTTAGPSAGSSPAQPRLRIISATLPSSYDPESGCSRAFVAVGCGKHRDFHGDAAKSVPLWPVRSAALRPRILSFRVRFERIVRRLRGGFLWGCVERALAMEAVQRAVVLASHAFTAGIPFVIVLSAVAPRDRDLADRLIARFHLHGSTADQVRALFLTHNDIGGAVTWIGVVFLIVSLFNLESSLQVVYERALSVPHVGLRSRWRAPVWLLGTAAYVGEFIQLRPNVFAGGANIGWLVLSMLGSYVYWLWTPRILLGPRVSRRRLALIAALTTAAVTLLTIASPLYMPRMIRDDAARFGTIGVAFALLSWLIVLAFLVVGSAVVASQLDGERVVLSHALGTARGRAAPRFGVEAPSAAATKTQDAPPERGAADHHRSE